MTIEHGHGNHLANEMASTAYWYAPNRARPPCRRRWPPACRCCATTKAAGCTTRHAAIRGRSVPLNAEMNEMKARAARTAEA